MKRKGNPLRRKMYATLTVSLVLLLLGLGGMYFYLQPQVPTTRVVPYITQYGAVGHYYLETDSVYGFDDQGFPNLEVIWQIPTSADNNSLIAVKTEHGYQVLMLGWEGYWALPSQPFDLGQSRLWVVDGHEILGVGINTNEPWEVQIERIVSSLNMSFFPSMNQAGVLITQGYCASPVDMSSCFLGELTLTPDVRGFTFIDGQLFVTIGLPNQGAKEYYVPISAAEMDELQACILDDVNEDPHNFCPVGLRGVSR